MSLSLTRIIEEIKEEVQIFDFNLIRDGFDDDTTAQIDRAAISALNGFNHVGRDLAGLDGCIQKYISFTLSEGERQLCPDAIFSFVYEVQRIGPDNQAEVLRPFTLQRQGFEEPFTYRTASTGIPREFGFLGKVMYFDKAANQDYTIKLLADTEWTDITADDDVIDTGVNPMHYQVFISGGGYYAGRKAMNNPNNRNDDCRMRLKELKDEYNLWRSKVVELHRSRFLQNIQPLLVDDGRTDLPYLIR